LATSHDRTAPACPPSPSRRPVRRARSAGLLTALATALLVASPLLPAAAAPGDARSERDAVADEVARIEEKVERAEEELQRMTLEAEAASDAVLKTRTDLARARTAAETAAEALAEAEQAVARLQDDVATLGREAYMGEDNGLGDVAVLLDAQGPDELLQRAATMELLGVDRARALEVLERLEVQRARADRAARDAVAQRDAAAVAAAEAEARIEERLADAQKAFDAMTAEKRKLDRQLKRAEIRLLELENAPEPEQAWEEEQAVEQAAEVAVSAVRSAGGAVAPTTGRVTSCYGARWGTMHLGVDIAAPIGTPVHTPEPGVVLQAGPASGFGQAVYVQHSDGSITLYGHVSRFHVSAGQTVAAGQLIADVGNEGQSTGPHLHFEVHTGGLYANRADPMPWLTARGISLGGC
jgi:murein DD-endopeptidase MepM/ murein hydrolase activator NlpD